MTEWDWDAALKKLSSGIKERLAGLEQIHANFVSGAVGCASLDRQQLCDLVDLLTESLSDNNHKVSQTALQVLSFLVKTESDTIKPYANAIVPLVVERLGDTRQQVRQDACELLLSMFTCMGPQYILQKMARFWNHRAWKVRHGVLQTVAEAIAAETPGIMKNKEQNEYIITQVVNLMEDPNEAVRDAALECLQEMYRLLRGELLENLKSQNIRSTVYKEVIARLNAIAPTNIIVPDAPPSGGSNSGSGRIKTSQGGANHARGEADATASVHVKSSTKQEGSSGEAGGQHGAASKASSAMDASQVPVVHMHSEKELIGELEAMALPLAGTVAGWQQRISCMQRLQGIAAGCSPHLQEVLLDNFRALREPMVKQLEDRRSAVSKQACQTLSALSDIYGLRFQELLLHYLPVLLRNVPITVQVIREAADQGIRKMLFHCQTPRAIPLLVNTLKTDKNACIRSSSASYLAQAMETWDIGALGVRADDFESGMKTAAQDASAEARQAARALYAGYMERMPDHAHAFIRRLEPWLADKLQSKNGAELQRKASIAHPKPFLSFSRPQSAAAASTKDEIIIMAPPLPRSATFAPTTSAAAVPQLNHSSTIAHPGSAAKPRPATAGAKPMAGPARVEHSMMAPQEYSTGGPQQPAQVGEAPKPMTSKARRSSVQAYAANMSHTPAQRVLTTPLPSRPVDAYGTGGPIPYGGNAGPASTVPPPGVVHRPSSSPASSSHPNPQHQHSSNSAADFGGGVDGGGGQRAARSSGYNGSVYDQQGLVGRQQAPRALMPVSKIAAALLAGPKLWNEKVELLNMLVEAVQRLGAGEVRDSQGLPADPSRDLERLAPKFIECIEESHAKVVVAALDALSMCIKLCAFAFDPHMERLLPCLFMRLQDQKDNVRNLSNEVLQEVAVHYNADILLAGLIRALEANKQPKSKMSILEFSTAFIGHSRTAGIPTASAMHLKQWLSRVTSLLLDKNGELRKRASEAVESLYFDVDAHTVVAFAHHSTGAEGMALKRLLATLQEQHPQEEHPPQSHQQQHQQQLQQHTPLHLSPPHASNDSHLSHSQPTPLGGSSQGLGAVLNPPAGLLPPPSTTSSSAAYSHQHSVLPQPQLQQPLQPQHQPRSFPITLSLGGDEQHAQHSMASGLGSSGAAPSSQPAPYQPAQYMTPYKVDPSRLSTIGPIVADHEVLPPSSSTIGTASTQQPPPSDPAAQARLLSLLTHRLANTPSEDTLLQLIDLTCKVGPGPWESVFASLLPSLVQRVCCSPCDAHRELAMVLVDRLASHQPQLMRAPATLQALLPAVLSCEADASKEVILAASHAVACLVLAAPPQKVFDILSAMLPPSPAAASSLQGSGTVENVLDAESRGEVACAACRCVQRMAHSSPVEELGPRVALDLLPGLVHACDHVRADVRKAAVFAIAEMWHKLGDAGFSVHLAKLSQQQQHLVSWAYERIKHAAALPSGPPQ